MKNFALKDPEKMGDNIKMNYDSVVDFSNAAGINYSTAYRLLRGQRANRPSAIKFAKEVNGDKKEANLTNIFLLK